MILTVIPARGGSKGVPRKNIKTLAGVPLLGYTAKAALESCNAANTIVSTDDPEIAEIAEEMGLTAPFLRPENLAGDSSKTADVLKHAIDWVEENWNKEVNAVMTLQPTTPLRNSEDIDNAIDIFNKHNAECLISVCKMEKYHPLTMYLERKDGQLETMMKELDPNTRRQDFPSVYWRNGAIYITSKRYIFDTGKVTSHNPIFYEMPEELAVNIDSEADFEYAEYLIKNRNQ